MSDETDKILAGLGTPAGAAESNLESTPAASASAQVVTERKKRSDIGIPRGSRKGTASAGLPPLSQAQFAQLYNPEIWAKALAAPADAMAAIGGKKHWLVSDKEREALGATGSIAAQCFAVTDPRWLAASLALITVLDVYGIRIAMEMADRKREREEKAKAAKNAA